MARVDLHCHTSASFDGVADPAALVMRARNDQAAALAARAGVPGIGASDAYTLIEVGAVCTEMTGDPGTPSGLLSALRGPMAIVHAEPAAPPRGPLGRLLHLGMGPVRPAR